MQKNITITGGLNLEKFIKNIVNQKSGVEAGLFDAEQAIIGIYNEYGTMREGKPHIPPRPFMQNAINTDEKKWQTVFGNQLVKNKYDVYQSMTALGATVAESIQNSIVNGSYVDNAPATIARKGFNKPLIDTGLMLQAITFRVQK